MLVLAFPYHQYYFVKNVLLGNGTIKSKSKYNKNWKWVLQFFFQWNFYGRGTSNKSFRQKCNSWKDANQSWKIACSKIVLEIS